MSLRPHHAAWLMVHPDRSEAWLKVCTSDGFHVHHVDGDHVNNAQDNLVLIEKTGHVLLHRAMPKRRVGKASIECAGRAHVEHWPKHPWPSHLALYAE